MPKPIDVGTGIAIVFQTSGFNAYLLDISGPNITRDQAETTHYGTVGGKTFIPGDLYDPGDLTLEVGFDPDTVPPIFNAERAETITITWPLAAGGSAAATWSFQGFVTGFAVTPPLEDRMTASVTVKLTGSITRNAAS